MKFKLFISLMSVLFCALIEARVVVISDIDDTIKKANSEGTSSGRTWHFFRKRIYPEMRDLFQELDSFYSSKGVDFFYVSAAPDAIFDQYEWLDKHQFPSGKAFLRQWGDGSIYKYKRRVILRILSRYRDVGELKVFFFGDNSSEDAKVYLDAVKELNLKEASIFIRDVSTMATNWSTGWSIESLPGIHYFFSERELIGHIDLDFMSLDLTNRIHKTYRKRTLIPEYTFNTLYRRVVSKLDCGDYDYPCYLEAYILTDDFWQDYYNRF